MRTLTLLAPGGLALLALAAPLLLLYVLKSNRRVVRVPSTWLWASAKRDLLARSPFQKLVAQVPLFLELSALCLLALAFARPVARSREPLGGHVALIIDVSASMSAKAKAHSSRLDEAKERARDFVGSLAPDTEVMVISAGANANIASPLERDKRRVLSTIANLAIEEIEGDLAPALALATDRISRTQGPRIVVVTDGALARPTSLDGVALPLEVLTVGDKVDNIGIVRVDVRSGTDALSKREQVQAFLMLASSGTDAHEVYVTMREDNASDILASRRLVVEPGEKLPVLLSFFPSPGDYRKGLVFDVSPHDAMEVDDVAYGRVPAGEKLPVVLISEPASESPWLERAFASDPNVSLSKGTSTVLGGALDKESAALVVVLGACPKDPPGGDLLIVNPPEGACQGVNVGRAVDHPTITSWDTIDPRLRFVSFEGVTIDHARQLSIDSPKSALVRGRDGALIVDASRPGRTVTLVGFDVGESDWPLKASFVLFVRDLLEEARSHRATSFMGSAKTGTPLVIDVPRDASLVDVVRPGARSEPLEAHDGVLLIPDVMHSGFYRITNTKEHSSTVVVPVNLTSANESDLSRALADHPFERVDKSGAETPVAYRDYAWMLALGALFFLVGDVAWISRRPRIPKPQLSA